MAQVGERGHIMAQKEVISTREFQDMLLAAPVPEDFLKRDDFVELDLRAYLNQMLDEKGLSRKEVIARARINETCGWELFNIAHKKPGRDKLIALAFALGLDLVQTRRLLRNGQTNDLYAKDARDAVIIVAISRGATLGECDQQLYAHGLDTVCEG